LRAAFARRLARYPRDLRRILGFGCQALWMTALLRPIRRDRAEDFSRHAVSPLIGAGNAFGAPFAFSPRTRTSCRGSPGSHVAGRRRELYAPALPAARGGNGCPPRASAGTIPDTSSIRFRGLLIVMGLNIAVWGTRRRSTVEMVTPSARPAIPAANPERAEAGYWQSKSTTHSSPTATISRSTQVSRSLIRRSNAARRVHCSSHPRGHERLMPAGKRCAVSRSRCATR